MKVWAVAWNTYRGLLRNRALLALILFFLFIFLSSAGGLYYAARLDKAGAAAQAQAILVHLIGSLLSANVVFFFILAGLAGAYVLPTEIKTGTILPTLGRAVSRTEFLLGLFLGINLLLLSYLGLVALATGGLLAGSGVKGGPHLLVGLVYLVLGGNIVAAVAFFFSVLVSPLVALVATSFFLSLRGMAESIRLLSQVWGDRVGAVVDYILPAWKLLDYSEYLQVARTPAKQGLDYYSVGLAHGIDYLALFLLAAVLLFRRRSLLPPT